MVCFNKILPALPQVQFEVADATKRTFPEASFDVIYSRDTILHIEDKLALFKRFHVSIFSSLNLFFLYVLFEEELSNRKIHPRKQQFIPLRCCFKEIYTIMWDDYIYLLTHLFILLLLCGQSWLKPGGQLLISDYCCGEKPWTPVFEAYVKQRAYILYTPSQYGKVSCHRFLWQKHYVRLAPETASLLHRLTTGGR